MTIRTSGNAARSRLIRYRVFDGALGGRSARHTTEKCCPFAERHQFRSLHPRACYMECDRQIVDNLGQHSEG